MTYTQFTDYNSGDTTLPLFMKDGGADAGTQFLVDFLDPNSYSGGVLPSLAASLLSGTILSSLGYVANTASLSTTFPSGLGTAGLIFDSAASRVIALPRACILGGLFSGSVSGTIFTLTSVTNGALPAGAVLFGTGITTGSAITSLASGTWGAAGSTYNLNASSSSTGAITITANAPSVHFAFGMTIKTGTPTGSAGSYTPWATLCTNTGSQCQWAIQQSYNSPTQFTGIVGGVQLSLTVPAGVVTQVIWEAILTGGILTLNGYFNGVFVGSTSGALAYLPVPNANPLIGANGVFGGSTPVGAMGRFTFEDLTQPRASPIATFIANEYAQVAGPRFS